MKLHEFQAKEVFGSYHIPVQQQLLAYTPDEAAAAAEQLGGTVVVKAQVLSGGRGKAGGVKVVSGADAAKQAAADIFQITVQDMAVQKVLIVPAVDIQQEYYFAITVDRSSKKARLMFSAQGGMEIEQLAEENPDAIVNIEIDPLHGLSSEDIELIANQIGCTQSQHKELDYLVRQLYRLFLECDASLVEVNPLARIGDGTLSALDAKMVIDDNSLYKHDKLSGLRNDEEYHPDEIVAKADGLSFVSLEGSIGCIVNGAGLAMTTMDLIQHFGGKPANFLDVGGSSNPQKVITALKILSNNQNIESILINIFGGITRCDDIANGLLLATKELDLSLPLTIRLVGTNEQEGKTILQDAGYSVYSELNEAVKQAVSYQSA